MNEDRSASFVELFFDLVFVFGVTQVVASIHGHLDFPTLWRAAVVLALLWWAWTQYTWIAGQADFDELRPRIIMLLATAGTFVTAVSVQGAWGDEGGFFATGYFFVMALGAAFFLIRASGTDLMQGAIAYIPRTMAGSTLVLIGGFVDGDPRTWLWVGGVALNLIAAAAAGRYEYQLNIAHFTERHGLFVIIVLGEGLIAIGATLVGHADTTEFFVAGTAMLIVVLSMWWSYFDAFFKLGAKALEASSGPQQSNLARDAYSILHYPLVAGVILFAVGTEELLAHPEMALETGPRWAFAGGLAMYFASHIAMMWRLFRGVAWERMVLVALLLGAATVLESLAAVTLSVVITVVVLAALTMESMRFRTELRSLR